MAKQSPKDPKFRCNICKEYYYAPEHMVHYQCPKHGYLCKDHIGQKGQLVYGHDLFNNPNKTQKEDIDEQNDPYWDKIIELPNSIIGKCLCDYEKNYDHFGFHVYNRWVKGTPYESLESVLENGRCFTLTAKYTWSQNAKRWIEEGREKEEDFLIFEKLKVTPKSNNSEIKLLLDLFEKNILTKEQFLEQVKGNL